MKDRLAHLAFPVLVLLLGGSLEELLPKFLGVGFPLLLSASLVWVFRRDLTSAVLFAVAAGGMEDALSALPPATSVSFFLAAAFLVRLAGRPVLAMVFAFPLYQLWLCAWRSSGGAVFGRFLVALTLGVVTVTVVEWVLDVFGRRAGIDE